MDTPQAPTPENVNPSDFLPPLEPTPLPEEPQIVVSTPEVGTSSTAVIGPAVTANFAEKKIKPFETTTLILVAVMLIWCGMGIKHIKKPVVKPTQKAVVAVKKESPKAVIKVTPAIAQKKIINVNPRARTETRDPGWKKWGPKK